MGPEESWIGLQKVLEKSRIFFSRFWVDALDVVFSFNNSYLISSLITKTLCAAELSILSERQTTVSATETKPESNSDLTNVQVLQAQVGIKTAQ
jgi:hypothetical protein